MAVTIRLSQDVLSLDRYLEVGDESRTRGMDPDKVIALGYVYEQFGNPQAKGVKDPGLVAYMQRMSGTYYENLVQRQDPEKQIVYLDFEAFAETYRQKFQPMTKMDYGVWQEKFLTHLISRFQTEKGHLNLEFVTVPPGTPCIRIVFSGKGVVGGLMERSDVDKIEFMRSAMAHEWHLPVVAVRDARREFPDLSDDEVLLKAFADPRVAEWEQLSLSDKSGITFNPVPEDFGNLHPESLVVMNARNLGRFSYDVVADVVAHEIGHALGLHHPGMEYGRLQKKPSQYQWNGEGCHLMHPLFQESWCLSFKNNSSLNTASPKDCL